MIEICESCGKEVESVVYDGEYCYQCECGHSW
jgi:lysyl-tRNA synthetase class I